MSCISVSRVKSNSRDGTYSGFHVPLYIITDMTNVPIHLDTFFHYISKITFFESKCTKHVNGFSL